MVRKTIVKQEVIEDLKLEEEVKILPIEDVKIEEEEVIEIEESVIQEDNEVNMNLSWIVMDKSNRVIETFSHQQDAIDLQKRFAGSKVLYKF